MTDSQHCVHNVMVAGAGAMGSQIAMVCALAGLQVSLYDVDAERLTEARALLRRRMDRRVTKGDLSPSACDAAFDRLTSTTNLAVAASDADLVIEAIIEVLEAKRTLFATLDSLCGEDTVFASNSSSFVPSSMTVATRRADRFCNMHFFNPPLVMRGVEVVGGPDTSPETMERVVALTRRLGKEPILLKREINGFIANRILNAIRDEATFLMENDYAGIEAIDAACRLALGHPLGPYELQDLTGLDIGYLVRKARYETSGDDRDLPSPSLSARVEAGHLGRKTGQGWYRYDADGRKQEPTDRTAGDIR